MTIDLASRLLFSAFMLAVVVWDVVALRIPDRLVLLILAAFVVVAALQGLSYEDLLSHVAAGLLLFSFFLAAAVVGPMGGGDVKLAGAIGLWAGLGQDFAYFGLLAGLFYYLLMAAAYAVRMLALWTPVPLPSMPALPWVDDLLSGNKPFMKCVIPFGPPLAMSALVLAWA